VWLAVEVAEQTARGADISRIDISVNLPSDNIGVRHKFSAQRICRLREHLKWSIVIEIARLVIAQRLTI
jgi:hypothetical protein